MHPQLERLKQLTIDRYSCDKDGYTSVFFNEYAILKFWIDISLRDLEVFEEPTISEYKTIIIDYYMQMSREEWENKFNSGLFNEELSEDEQRYQNELHNSHIRHLRQLQRKYY